ncbi:type ISP restriction/modification enzyme [Acinetobacter gerneri]|uniref:type ISP restriction/modification enzyme n=1 Tax=Acinetobacter gerneri TaxID=202952 RepID=UPI00280E59DA|nr:type ISP restriction/modification enzyme [Acinetobacter gerneri]MDQ9053229.1 type ISP restriction/modification enzyme [Acinetobacter gerneri]MDQ9060847.1 type ISP restriction/modification enzyme [Acinetobacter gerneri]MDQ9088399.1 type ISP restriction/modification enzyme [Acinetobacter gerneri]
MAEKNNGLFSVSSLGVVTGRDAWNYDYSVNKLKNRTSKALSFFNAEIERYKLACSNLDPSQYPDMMEFVKKDLSITSWGGRSWKSPFKRHILQKFNENQFRINLYRPFTKQYHFNSTVFNHSFYSIRSFFPTIDTENLTICITGLGGKKGFSTIISNIILDLNALEAGAQCFPLYVYEDKSLDSNADDLFSQTDAEIAESKYTRKDSISDIGLKHFQAAYPTETINKEDIFYYVYGLLHSEDYRSRYADNLTKELPRIPCVKKAEDFWAFSKAGRDLAYWHLNYETVEPYKAKLDLGSKSLKQLEDKDFYVTKMKFAKKDQKDTVVYNNAITIREIPVEAYDYIVNGKSALEWVMERQGVSTHKDSGIVNDANDWAIETMGDAKYPLELFLRVITVSLETMKIVRSLPKLDI